MSSLSDSCIFLAFADFKSAHVSDPIELVDVYQVVCKVLGMTSSPHNGTWARVSGMFKPSSASEIPTLSSAIVFISLTFLFCNG